MSLSLEQLEAEGHAAAIVIVGGAALTLIGAIDRATRDVDVIALGEPARGNVERILEPPAELSDALRRAARLVAQRMGLEPGWLNAGPALQWRQGLPEGFAERVVWRRYAALQVGVTGRRDLIFLKLFAAADSTGPTSVHYQDLLRLQPARDELAAAARWVKTQDASPSFPGIVDKVVLRAEADTK